MDKYTDDQLLQRRRRLTTQVSYWGMRLKQKIKFADSTRLLATIAICESDYGRFDVPRHENSFCANQKGKYSSWERHKKWGCLTCCSYGPFQMMYPIALELGLSVHTPPTDFAKDEVCLPCVVALIENRILKQGAASLAQFADAYNSGTHRDSLVPVKYVEKFVETYDGRVLAYLKESSGGIAYG